MEEENQDIRRENTEIQKELQEMKKSTEIIEKERRRNMIGLKIDTNEPALLK